jgi:hypothetical protein
MTYPPRNWNRVHIYMCTVGIFGIFINILKSAGSDHSWRTRRSRGRMETGGRESGCRTSVGLYRRRPLRAAASTGGGSLRRTADGSGRSNDIVISILF